MDKSLTITGKGKSDFILLLNKIEQGYELDEVEESKLCLCVFFMEPFIKTRPYIQDLILKALRRTSNNKKYIKNTLKKLCSIER